MSVADKTADRLVQAPATREEEAANAARWGNKLFLPALTILVLTVLGTFGLKRIELAGGPIVDVKQVTVISLAIATLVALVNLRGVGESVKANVVLTCVELTGLLIVIGVGVWALGGGGGDFSRVVEFDTGERSLLGNMSPARPTCRAESPVTERCR